MAPILPSFSSSSSSSSAADIDISAAVDAVIAEATDLCALEQIAKLNTAHLSESSLLPSDLEARFRKLKSFPVTNSKPRTALPPSSSFYPAKENIPTSLDRSATAPISPTEVKDREEPAGKIHADEAENFPPVNREASTKLKSKSKTDLGSSPSFSFEFLQEPPSPPRQTCCFGLSPKKVVHRRKGKGDDILSEFGVLRVKEEQRKLKKALKEQEKANKEAEKIVKWVKQASARMNVAMIDEWPSDDEELK